MGILDTLVAEARKELRGGSASLRIDNIILGKSLYTMKGSQSVFTDMNLCMVLLEDAYGFSYFQQDIDYSAAAFVNKNLLELLEGELPIYVRVALVDALYSLVNKGAFQQPKLFIGDIRQKARQRATVLLSQVPTGSHVLLLGASAEIIEEANARACSLRVFDLEPQKVGLRFGPTLVEDGINADLERALSASEYTIATGMVFQSGMADHILEWGVRDRTKLMLYMQTGSNFGPQLLRHGAHTVLCEFFPYYDFHGSTQYLILRSQRLAEAT